ncbi:MAG: helix-turn-helix domain-containing protein [Pyrinomonadaceae bacterium]|nr:helix-turn-helix domain-containing protein [Pyrinomonadaceae bacterium]
MITITEAARLRGVTAEAIRSLARRGRLRSVRKYEKLLVYRSDVLSFEKDKPGPRGPRKSAKKT